jgi:hypothetical protein
VRKEANGPTNQKKKTKQNKKRLLAAAFKKKANEVKFHSFSQSVSQPDWFFCVEGTARFTYSSLDQSIKQSINPHWPAVLWSEPVDKEKKKKQRRASFKFIRENSGFIHSFIHSYHDALSHHHHHQQQQQQQ